MLLVWSVSQDLGNEFSDNFFPCPPHSKQIWKPILISHQTILLKWIWIQSHPSNTNSTCYALPIVQATGQPLFDCNECSWACARMLHALNVFGLETSALHAASTKEHTHTHTHIYIYAHVCIHIYIYMYICMHMCLHVCLYTCINKYIYIYVFLLLILEYIHIMGMNG